MSGEKVNRFLKVQVDSIQYKLFLDDLQGIYRFKPKKTPALKPYLDISESLSEFTSEEVSPSEMNHTGTVRTM